MAVKKEPLSPELRSSDKSPSRIPPNRFFILQNTTKQYYTIIQKQNNTIQYYTIIQKQNKTKQNNTIQYYTIIQKYNKTKHYNITILHLLPNQYLQFCFLIQKSCSLQAHIQVQYMWRRQTANIRRNATKLREHL